MDCFIWVTLSKESTSSVIFDVLVKQKQTIMQVITVLIQLYCQIHKITHLNVSRLMATVRLDTLSEEKPHNIIWYKH